MLSKISVQQVRNLSASCNSTTSVRFDSALLRNNHWKEESTFSTCPVVNREAGPAFKSFCHYDAELQEVSKSRSLLFFSFPYFNHHFSHRRKDPGCLGNRKSCLPAWTGPVSTTSGFTTEIEYPDINQLLNQVRMEGYSSYEIIGLSRPRSKGMLENKLCLFVVFQRK